MSVAPPYADTNKFHKYSQSHSCYYSRNLRPGSTESQPMNESSGGGPQGGGGEPPPARGRGRGRGWNPNRGRGRGHWPRKSGNSHDVRVPPNSHHYEDNWSRDGSQPAFRGNQPDYSSNAKRSHQQPRKHRGAGGQHHSSRGHLEEGFHQMGLSEEHLSWNNYYDDSGSSTSFRGHEQSHNTKRGHHHHQQHQQHQQHYHHQHQQHQQRTYRTGGENRSNQQREDQYNPRHRASNTSSRRQEENLQPIGPGEEDVRRNNEDQVSNGKTRGERTKNVNKSNKSRTRRKDQGGPRSEEKDSNLRSRLTELCLKGMSECMVCLDKVKQHQLTWDCRNCYQVGNNARLVRLRLTTKLLFRYSI